MHILGIHLDPPFLYGALIRKTRQGIEIISLKVNLLQEIDPNVKQLYMTDGGELQLYITSGLSPKDFLIRSMELKIASHIEEAIVFQSEATTHFNPADILTVPLLQKKEKGKTEALLFTVPRDALKEHIDQLAKVGIDPDCISAIPLGLCHFVRWKFPSLSDAFMIHLGSSEFTCALMEKGELKKAHSIAGGVESLLAALFEDRKKILLKKEIEGAAKQIDLLLLKSGLNPHLTSNLNELKQNVAKVLFSMTRGEKKPVIFTGRTDAFIHLKEFILEDSDNLLTLEEQKFAVSIGLALEQTTSRSLQLRKEEFFPQKNWKRLGFFALSIMGASLLLSAFLLGFGFWASHSQKSEMLHSLQMANEGAVEEKIDAWIAAIEKNNKEYPYILQSPRVAEVFSWISSHPLLNAMKREGDPIDIREIRYQLVTLPKIDSPKDPYLTKVELEFRFKSAMNARKFHEALRSGDNLVNPGLEIAWDALQDSYRTSFFLKNRSPYVP